MQSEEERSGNSGAGLHIGVMGGSFDPPHTAHLIMAECAREALRLDRVLFLPAGEQPLKRGLAEASVRDRVEMTRLAIEGNPYFELSRVDVEREGPSYTVDTLRILGGELGGPERAALWLIVGADSVLSFPRWRDPQGILAQARLAVVRRPDYEVDFDQVESGELEMKGYVDWVEAPLMEISSTDIRGRIREGRSVRYRLPDAVREYIEERGLYTGV